MAAGSPDPLGGLRPDHQLYRHHYRPDRAPVRHRPTWTLTATNRHVYTCNITNTPANPSLSIATTASPSAVTHVGS